MRWTQADKRDWQALLRGIRNAIASAGQTTVEAIGENTKAQQKSKEPEPHPQPERITVDVQISRAETDRYYSEQRSSQKLQWWTFWATVGTFIAVAAYAVITLLQWRTMNATYEQIQKQTAAAITAAEAAKWASDTASKQFVLSRDQLIYTQSAKVMLQVMLTLSQPEPGFTTLYINFFNDGHETASHVRADLLLAQKTVPGERLVGQLKPFSIILHNCSVWPYPSPGPPAYGVRNPQ